MKQSKAPSFVFGGEEVRKQELAALKMRRGVDLYNSGKHLVTEALARNDAYIGLQEGEAWAPISQTHLELKGPPPADDREAASDESSSDRSSASFAQVTSDHASDEEILKSAPTPHGSAEVGSTTLATPEKGPGPVTQEKAPAGLEPGSAPSGTCSGAAVPPTSRVTAAGASTQARGSTGERKCFCGVAKLKGKLFCVSHWPSVNTAQRLRTIEYKDREDFNEKTGWKWMVARGLGEEHSNKAVRGFIEQSGIFREPKPEKPEEPEERVAEPEEIPARKIEKENVPPTGRDKVVKSISKTPRQKKVHRNLDLNLGAEASFSEVQERCSHWKNSMPRMRQILKLEGGNVGARNARLPELDEEMDELM